MGLDVSIKISGVQKLSRRIREIGKVPKNLNNDYIVIDKLLRREWGRNFTKQGTRKGQWKPLSAGHIAYRTRKGYLPSAPILIMTGELFKGVIGIGSNTIRRIGKQRAQMGVRKDGVKAINALREFITLPNGTKKLIMKVFSKHVQKAMRTN